jgi:hypothetical protein
MILLVVVAFLALFSVMGVTYIIYADSQLRQTADDVNAQDVRQNPIKMVDLDPSFILNFFLERFLYDQADVALNTAGAITNLTPDSVYSALRGHSLARNIYGGYEPGTGAIAGPAPVTGGVLTDNSMQPTIPLIYGGSGYQSAPAVTITGGGATTNATAYAELTNGVVTKIVIVDGGAGYTSAPTVSLTAPLNDRPFSGTGKLNKQVTLNGQNLEEWKIVNMAFPVTGKDQITGQPKNFMLAPERVKFDTAGALFVDNGYPYSKTSSWNAPYTYPDHNNFYLGWLKSDGTKVQPSFHRDYIFGHGQIPADIFNLPVANTPSTSQPTGNLNWINPVGKYLFARPRPVDHLSMLDLNSLPPLPNNPTQSEINVRDNATINLINQRIFESKLFPYPEADGMDVKNLEGYPGGNDSVWIDVGSPVFKTLDGRKYKIMIAPLILDLDGKINLNVAGNVMASLKDPLNPHASNQGWGPWEVNPAKIAQSSEIQTMINSYINPNTGKIQLPGRYTNAFRIPTGFDGSMVNYPSGVEGSMVNPPYSPSYSMVDYNGTLDNGAVGNEGYFKTPAFNDLNAVSPFQSFPYFPTKNFGAAGNAEIKNVAGDYNHASLYNSLRPTYSSKVGFNNLVVGPNRGFSPRETASLLNWGSKSGTLSSSSLMQFFPNSMEPQNPNTTNPQTIKNRSFVTTLSTDFARITTPPYIANSLGSPYQMNGNYPKGNDIAYASSGTSVTAGATSDLDKTSFYDTMNSVIVTQTSSLRSINSKNMKLDLTRKLADYPVVSYPSILRNTTDLPFQSNLYFDVTKNGDMKFTPGSDVAVQTADLQRQQFAMDIFQALILATGAKQVNQIPLDQNDLDFQALKYLAQLAVNMVDYIDNDDVMTCFTWKKDPGGNSAQDEKVFGFEVPKLVINEGYAEIINGGADAGDDFENYTDANNMMKKRAKKDFEIHFWFELLNPMNDSQVQSTSQNAWLEQDPFNLTNSRSPIYQIEVVDKTNTKKLLLGDPTAPLSFYKPDTSTKFLESSVTMKPFHYSNPQNYEERACKFVSPSVQNQYQGALSSNSGFFVMGSTRDFPGSNNAQLELTNLRHPMLSYSMGKGDYLDVNNKFSSAKIEQTITDLQNHKVIVRRLANPYKSYNNDPADLRFNPFVEVDNLPNLNVNDAVKYAAEAERKDPTPNPNPNNIQTPDWYLQMTDKEQRTSKAKISPYSSSSLKSYLDTNINMMTKKHDTKLRAPSNNSPGFVLQPAVGKPQTTLLRHNATWVDTSTQVFPYKIMQNGVFVNKTTNAGVYYPSVLDEELNRVVPDQEFNLNLPFTWLVHLDRVPISMPELMHVSGVAPKDVTTAFNNAAFTDGTNPIGHKAPWLDGGSRLARFLEFAHVKSRQNGVAKDGRLPGLVNINSIWDGEVFRALADAKVLYDPTNSNNFIESEIDAIFGTMFGDRSPSAFPAQNDKPFWSLGIGKSAGGDDWTSTARGLNNTILRNNATLFDLPAANTVGQNRDAYQKKELLTKIFNSITTKSNTFGVWLTAGYFEVTDDTVKPAKLGAEIGKADGNNIRHRMFAIVDRTNMVNAKKTDLAVVFNTNVNGLMQDTTGNPLPPINLEKPVLINPANNANINLVNGMTVTIDANTDYEETVSVVLAGNGDFWFTPQKLHNPIYMPAIGPNPAYYQNTIKTIINRGNPGPWVGYDRTKDRDVVPYAEIIE